MSVCMSAGMNTITLSVSALLLDMDGTLVCSTGDVEKVWRLWCQHHQLAPEPVLAMCHGMRSREVIRALAPQLDVEWEAARLDELEMLNIPVATPSLGLASCWALLVARALGHRDLRQ